MPAESILISANPTLDAISQLTEAFTKRTQMAHPCYENLNTNVGDPRDEDFEAIL